ncbi:unnamed protein product [Rotaria sordida]|uniref:Glycosyltransferase family 28 N-terminal domain-containing protein n=1 Tax=Rotaria sordida TaxID=392033 RepID=A0A815ZFM5_9BILA|nr:unnamed protein product [Rotaria sordida]CAF1582872.1 unnamed protein product [Rotaria sordida]
MESQTQVETFVVEQDNDNNKNKINKKIFIPTIGTLGDVKPFIILAQALKKRGHTVWLGVHKRFQDVAKAADIDTVEIGGDLEDILSATPEGIELQ